MRFSNAVRGIGMLVVLGMVILLPAKSSGAEKFDGNWQTRLVCPAKGDTQGYTWEFVSVVQNGNLHGERGTAGEPGYYTIDGKIGGDGSAKLNANGIVASRQYARGVLAHQGEPYSYVVKAKFSETTGSGTRDVGLGIVGRPCTLEFTKADAAQAPPSGPGVM